MPSNMNALLVAWAISLIVIIGGTVYLQLSYDDAAHHNETEEHASSEDTSKSTADGDVTSNANELQTTHTDGTQTDNHAVEDLDTSDDTDNHSNEQPLSDTTSNDSAPKTSPPEAAAGASSIINAVDPALLEDTRQGQLPQIAADGRQPSLFYAANTTADTALPRIAIIITDIGRRSRQSERALNSLPSEVTIAFSPYGTNLEGWADKARQKGHESLLMVPMEPSNTTQNDAGPLALLTANNSRQNLNLLRSSMSRVQGYVGIMNHMGSRFTAVSDSLSPVLAEINSRGLLFVDSRATQFSRAAEMSRALNIPTAINNSYIDEQPNQSSISAELTKLEGRARTLGASVGIIRAYPISINTINEWAAGLKERGYQLVPITQIVDRQPLSR
ncbi:divergent polysaccharide deacetylase family protein [Kordiimonas sp. SCSIO 12610]|uniref:divergent polysaccharide deacetylase family protein n=1 Tax=Kordiimonas sp. SCSIO 12610 TaxID=2829597 RepID=UPI00210E2A7B|nr:divergent polysaccharide deacetylase family protein [Kordiimonas sp. SCSIO 12610]UTW55822.1 divergent polysaccharide deacetylase family protein [Kordiimonas sp. SCSIO 12610]